MPMMIAFIALAVLLRIASLAVSIRNERRLKAGGGREYGAANSAVLALMHVLFYVAAIAEWSLSDKEPYRPGQALGMALYVFGAVMLVLVIRALGRLWTVKIILAPDHRLVVSGPFRWVRHPNYLLNILPELIGLALALQAHLTLLVGLPAYLVPLYVRIRQEERAMREVFPAYGGGPA